jgi:phosphonate transport system substrate-binding protein
MRLRRLLPLFIVFALVVAACGDDDDAAETTAAPATTAAPTTTTEAPMGIATINEGVLTVGSDIPWPPFEDFDASGEVIGFDADLVNEMARRVGLETEWIDTDFDTIFTQLATGRFDVVASGTTITPERAEQVNFTQPYYLAQQALTVNDNFTPGIGTVDDLGEGDSVAVQTGTTGRDWAVENLAPNGVEVREFPGAADTYNSLEGGQVTGVIFDEPSAVEEVGNRPGLRIAAVIDTNEYFGFPVDPENAELLAALDAALTDMLADGTYQAIYDTWFTAPAGSVLYEAPAPVAFPLPDWPERIVFGFVPSQDVEELQDDVDTFAAVLADALKIEVEGLVTTDYTGLGVAMGTGQADFGAFGPAGYVLAEQAFPGAIELVAQSERFGSGTYHGQWFTNDPSICAEAPVPGAFENLDPATGERLATGVPTLLGPTETVALQVGYNGDDTRDDTVSEGYACEAPLESVIGKTIAFTTETSTSGFIFPTVQLLNLGIAEDQYESIFTGGHDAAVTAVYNGDADIGLSFDDARRSVREELPDVGEKVIVFNLTPDIANDVIAVRSDLPDSLKAAFFDSINDYISTEEGELVMDNLYSWTAIARPDASSMQAIADAIALLGFA